ncbi:MAG: rhombotarget lipoprotein [Acidobacteriota bacterium]
MTKRLKTNALEFLYPNGTEAIAPTGVRLNLPVRVGLAFAPASYDRQDIFAETQKQFLLSRIAAAFEDNEAINSVEVIPSGYLSPRGSFDNLDRLSVAFGIDLMALVSYDQIQFSETGRSSWAYWTLVGVYFVKDEKNDTRTLLDAVIYDISSRAMLFHATGQSSSTGKSTPIDVSKDLRERSEAGFEQATDDLIANLGTALDAFEKEASTGLVRGPGTPTIAIYDSSGQQIEARKGGNGAGAFGIPELLGVGLLISLGLLSRRRKLG